jgi:hypothetical protein
MDAERLAALLDGRLDERRRAEAVARLASSDAELEVFVDALAVTRELEAEEAADGVVPLRPAARRPWWRRPGGHWAAVAAVLAGLALLPVLWNRSRGPDVGDPGGYAALLGGGGLPAGWDRTPWGSTRGPGDPLTEQARAVRVGAAVTDLEVAIASRDPRAAEIADEIDELLGGVPGGSGSAMYYREIGRRAGEGPDRLGPLMEDGRRAAAALLGDTLVAVGAWAEAARLAAARRDDEFFRSAETRFALEQADGMAGLPEPAREAVGRIRSAIAADGSRDWTRLKHAADELLRLLGD